MTEHRFETREQASIKAAEHILAALKRRIDAHQSTAMVVSGGTTPVICFATLAAAELNWSQVQVFLSDERWVASEHPDSNEKLVRDSLLTGAAKNATFRAVYRQGIPIEQGCRELEEDIRLLPSPFACVLLGMGNDGHFASLFPDFSNLTASLDPQGEQLCVPVHTAASPHPRVSLTLSALCRSDEIILLIFGEEKWQTLEKARLSDDAYPVSRLLLQNRTPVHIFWAA